MKHAKVVPSPVCTKEGPPTRVSMSPTARGMQSKTQEELIKLGASRDMDLLEVGLYANRVKDFVVDDGCCLVQPTSRFMQHWDPTMMVLLVFVAFGACMSCYC